MGGGGGGGLFGGPLPAAAARGLLSRFLFGGSPAATGKALSHTSAHNLFLNSSVVPVATSFLFLHSC